MITNTESEIKQLDKEIKAVEVDIQRLSEKKANLLQRKQTLKNKLSDEATKILASQDWETSSKLIL